MLNITQRSDYATFQNRYSLFRGVPQRWGYRWVPHEKTMTGWTVLSIFWCQKLSRIKQRIERTNSWVGKTPTRLFLLSDIHIVLLECYLPRQCIIPDFGSEPRPLLKLRNCHFLFHIPRIMRFISPIISLLHRIILAFVIISALRTNVTAGLAGLFPKFSVTVGIVPTALDQEEFTAVPALIWHIVLLNTVEEIIVQKRSQIIKSNLLA